jgi:hypothetical protein
MSKKLRKKITKLEKELERQIEEERKEFWQKVYTLADKLDMLIAEEYNVVPIRKFYDSDWRTYMPTKYESALRDIAKDLLDLGVEP